MEVNPGHALSLLARAELQQRADLLLGAFHPAAAGSPMRSEV